MNSNTNRQDEIQKLLKEDEQACRRAEREHAARLEQISDERGRRKRNPDSRTAGSGNSRSVRAAEHRGSRRKPETAERRGSRRKPEAAERRGNSRKQGSVKRTVIPVWMVFSVSLLYNELMLKAFGGTGIFRNFFYIFFFALGMGLLLGAAVSLFRKKIRRRITKILLIAGAFLFSLECIIQSVYETYMSPQNLLSGAGNVAAQYTGELIRSILFGIPKMIVFAVPVILYFLFCGKGILTGKRVRKTGRVLFTAAAGITVLVLTSFAASRGKNAAVYGAQYDFNRATETFGLYKSMDLSFQYRVFGNGNTDFQPENDTEEDMDTASAQESAAHSVTPGTETEAAGVHQMDLDFSACTGSEELDALTDYIQSLTPSETNEFTGLFEGKNLIMVCAESYCGSFIREDLTPTLWRLTHNGFYFSEYYQPEWGGSTTTGEVAYNLGLSSALGDESMISTEENNNYFTLANQLQRLNYSTCAFHNGALEYYDRENTHPNLGYAQFIANENGIDELCGSYYPQDTELITGTVGLYLDKQPFCVYYMTLSGHAPYEEDNALVSEYYEQVDAAVGDEYDETTKYYICYQMELESAMSALVEELENAGIADDTVIVMTGDHYPYGLGNGEAWGNDKDYIEDLLGHSNDCAYEEDENTLVIWSGCLENEYKDMAVTVEDPVFCLDIVPTLSNLFGLEYDSRLLAGRDVFSDAEPVCYWNNLSWVTDKGKYDSYSETFYPRDGVEADESYVERINQVVQNRILMSRVIMANDYYGLLFGPDTVTQSGETIY